MEKITHVTRSQQFNKETLSALFESTARMKEAVQGGKKMDTLSGKLMAALFYEPSTRTRFSFASAMQRLGGEVVTTENAHEFSSATKGETLEDSIRVIASYVDLIVLRHDEVGAAARAAKVSAVPIINAGDGAGQHPTQALLDLYTIHDECGGPENKTVCFVGDLLYGRTVHSLVYLLAKYHTKKLCFVGPKQVALKDELKEYLTRKGITFEESEDLHTMIGGADIVYQTRIQRERFDDEVEYEKVYGQYVIDQNVLNAMKKDAIIMHPLPRRGEITEDVDRDPRAAYFRQAENGLYVRMALLDMILSP